MGKLEVGERAEGGGRYSYMTEETISQGKVKKTKGVFVKCWLRTKRIGLLVSIITCAAEQSYLGQISV